MEVFDLKQFRIDNGNITQVELAEILGCGQNFISNIENGRRNLPPNMKVILQSRFGDITKYYREVSNSDEQISVKATPQEFIGAGAEAFSRQVVKMMNDKLIAPYGMLLEKDKEIERLNRQIGRLEAIIENMKKGNAPQDGNASSAVAG